ncbi:hypothetical protein P9D34_06495 [Bacillus swezeyi]|uniref:Uncharacterized protein n=1 Tax=Bacillus swezeyi TaxID=1925020 RepID=A0A1R1QV62_9BACI|nr:hypothetical protein [Bacillus swezeyi]MEC1260101.1 hypothetical protein [Bacillus swezeyi]MED2927018.1 hypothetical protein [Bacillus swezeyi]MED2942631.1 hypothetical protein [Bacillus swezeyi]MED2964878.1 hypothetical protein [Bacillus swezeyi]MED2978859.1 hypothetical protein [Bacillus swezeyi]
MLKLKERATYKNLPDNIQSHLTASISRETKWGMACFIVLMLDILCLFPLLANEIKCFTFAAVPVAIVMNIWMIIMNVKNITSYHHKLKYVRFMGVSLSAISYCQLIVSQKLMFAAFGFHVPLIILSLFIYAAVIFLAIRYYLVVFPDDKRNKRSASSWAVGFFMICPAAGYIISHIALHFSESVVNLFISIVYLLMACLFSYTGIKIIHKYFFIKANQDIIGQNIRLYTAIKLEGDVIRETQK